MRPSQNDCPETIGRYQITGILGQGTMGVVYKGACPNVERPVAIKTIRADLLVGADGEDWLARFGREARAAGRCLHPNIVAVFDYNHHEGMPYIAMEYVAGRSVADFFKDGKSFDQRVSLYIVRQVLNALDYAHATGIVHRDIKPANVMLVNDGSVKVTDFGVARLDAGDLTEHGVIVGTPSCMSPEQFTGKPVDHRSDLFSCGVLLFELLTGHKPFPGSTMTEIMSRVLFEEPLKLTDVSLRASKSLSAVLRKALAKRPAARFQSAAEFSDALDGLGDSDIRAAKSLDADPEPDATVLASRDGTRAAPPRSAASPIDQALLAQLEAELAVYMGPISTVLIRNAAKRSAGIGELRSRLVRVIPDAQQARAFLERTRGLDRRSSGPTVEVGGEPPAKSELSEELLEEAEQGLAAFLGPIVKVLVKRAARKSTSREDLYLRLARHLRSQAERDAFLAGKPNA